MDDTSHQVSREPGLSVASTHPEVPASLRINHALLFTTALSHRGETFSA